MRKLARWALLAVLATVAGAGLPVQAADQSLELGIKATVNTSYFLPDFAFALYLHPKKLLATPVAKADKKLDALLAEVSLEVGYDFRQLDEVIFAAGPRERVEGEEFQGGDAHAIILRSSVPFVVDKLRGTLLADLEQIDEPGAKVFVADNVWRDSAALIGDRTLILARNNDLKLMLSKPKCNSALVRALENADPRRPFNLMVAAEPLRKSFEKFPGGEPPPPLQMGLKLLSLTPAVEVSVHSDFAADATIRTSSADAAQEAEGLVHGLLTAAKVGLGAIQLQLGKAQQANPEQVALTVMLKLLAAVEPKAEKHTVVARLPAEQGQELVAQIVQQTVPVVSRELARTRRYRATRQLQELVLALHNYESEHGKLPPAASVDKAGKHLLSWRVHMLPQLGEQELYEQFKLDEPWDSPHNKQLIEKMPATLRADGSPAGAEHKTVFLAVRGKDSVLGVGKSGTLEDIRDGTSNSIVMVRVAEERAVIWTKPDDYEYDPKQPGAGLARVGEMFHVGMADGSIQAWPVGKTPDETLRRAFQTKDGQPFKAPVSDDADVAEVEVEAPKPPAPPRPQAVE